MSVPSTPTRSRESRLSQVQVHLITSSILATPPSPQHRSRSRTTSTASRVSEMASLGTGSGVQREDGRLVGSSSTHSRLKDLFGLHTTEMDESGVPPRRAAVLRKPPPFYIRRPSISKQLAMDQRMMADELRIRIEEKALNSRILGTFTFEEGSDQSEPSDGGFEEVGGRDDAHGEADLFSPLGSFRVTSSPWAVRPNQESDPVSQSSFDTVPSSCTTPQRRSPPSTPPSYAIPPLPEPLPSPHQPSQTTARSRGASFSTAAFKSFVNLARRKSSVVGTTVTEEELTSWRRGSTVSEMTSEVAEMEEDVTVSIPGSASWDGARDDGLALDEWEKMQVQLLLQEDEVVVFQGRYADIEPSYAFPSLPGLKPPSTSLFDPNYMISGYSSPSTRFRSRTLSGPPPTTSYPRRPSTSRVPVPTLIIPSPKGLGLTPPPRPRKSPSRPLDPLPFPHPPSPRRMISSSAWMQISLSNAPPPLHSIPLPPRLHKKSSKRRGLAAAVFGDENKGGLSLASLGEDEGALVATPPPSPRRQPLAGLVLRVDEGMGTAVVV